MKNPLHTPAPPADQATPAHTCRSFAEAPAPSTTGQQKTNRTKFVGLVDHHQPTSAGGNTLKTQQADQVAGHADAHRDSPNGGAVIAPPPAPRAQGAEGEYHRDRDDDNLADTWCSDLGEFVQATGPPLSTSPSYP